MEKRDRPERVHKMTWAIQSRDRLTGRRWRTVREGIATAEEACELALDYPGNWGWTSWRVVSEEREGLAAGGVVEPPGGWRAWRRRLTRPGRPGRD